MKSLTIDTITTMVKGKNIVGLPSETDIAGIIWRMPINKKYTNLQRMYSWRV